MAYRTAGRVASDTVWNLRALGTCVVGESDGVA